MERTVVQSAEEFTSAEGIGSRCIFRRTVGAGYVHIPFSKSIAFLIIGALLNELCIVASTWPSADGLLSLKSLETLRIKVSIAFTNEYNYYIPQIITTALKAQRPMRSVTTIHITVMAFHDDTMERITRGWNNALNLDEWLQRTYPMLKKVVLEFVLGNNSVRDDESDEGWSPALVNFSRGAMKEMAENFWPALVESSSVIKIITPTAVFEL